MKLHLLSDTLGNALASLRSVGAFTATLLFAAAMALAQNDAHVSGTVTDPSGAHVVNATVTALNVATGAGTPVTTNEAGVYTMPSLPPGTYNFTAEHPGFRKAAINSVELQVGSVLTLNMGLELGQTTETVEVQAVATEVNATSASVGSVVEGKRLLDLPLAGRSAYDLLLTQAGVQLGTNFYLNGNQGNATSFTMDGISAMDNLHNSAFYLYSNVVSVDRAEEFRVVTSPADAEYGRGAGQVQMVTRGGTNRFNGSVYWEVRNAEFNANSYFNNLQGSPRSQLKQNNYGIRFGGPLKKNKTFFNGIYEPYKQRNFFTRNNLVYTQDARNGFFRFYPGFLNGNAVATPGTTSGPVVDLQGNPVQPAGATGPLQRVSVLGLDPNRSVVDPTGSMAHVLSYMPLPNNFRFGDGLNTAAFSWNQPTPVNFELYEGRVDHLFNDKHRIALTLNQQSYHSFNVASPPPYPSVPGNSDPTETTQYSAALTSIFRPNLLNDARIGIFRYRTLVQAPYELNQAGANNDVRKALLPTVGGSQAIVTPTNNINGPYGAGGIPGNYLDPTYQWGDDLTWIKGKHSFKGGFVLRYISLAGFDFGASNLPYVTVGAPIFGATNFLTGPTAIANIGQNATRAQNLLYDLSGTVTAATQFNISPGGTNPVFLAGQQPYHEWHQNEYSWYFKDDWKVTPSLTLNLGVRWEFYQTPTEAQGKMIAPVGGAGAVFGISGTNFGSLFNPNATGGSPTLIQAIGAGTAHPNVPLYNSDLNNFAPALGLAWVLPGEGRWKWLSGGRDKMTVRMGYGISYIRLPIGAVNTASGSEPGYTETDTTFAYNSLATLKLPVPPAGVPLSTVPSIGVGSHTQTLYAYDPNLRTPYTQNYNFSITRALTSDLVLNISYVGSKTSKLARGIDTNEVNIYENGILSAFNTVRAGGDSPLIDKIFAPLAGSATGSAFALTSPLTQPFFLNNNPGGFANFISTATTLGGIAGNLLKTAGLPLNYIVANPQFLHTYLIGNFGNADYNSLQVEANKRFSKGFTIQGSYVWSHNLGDTESDFAGRTLGGIQDSYRTLRNMHLDKRPLSFDYQSVGKINGLYELPIGKGKLIHTSDWLDKIVGGWQLGATLLAYSGRPLVPTAVNTINTNVGSVFSTPGAPIAMTSEAFSANALSALPAGGVQRDGRGVVYFNGFTQVTDPSVAGLVGSPLKAIAGPGGKLLLVNPLPGQLGALAYGTIRGPGAKVLNLDLKKTIRITERFNFQIGATALDATNTPIFNDPDMSIDSPTFGRILGTSTSLQAPGNRIMVLQGRFNF